jgi:membrane-bound lytic murein transglycosylase D
MSVGEAARRIGMNESELRAINSIPPRMLIKSGSVLIVPRKSTTQSDVGSHVADHGQLSLAPEIVTRRTVVRAGKRDSVATIARRYKLSAAQVADWNDVGASAGLLVLRPGRGPGRAPPPPTMRAKAGGTARTPVKAARKPVITKKRR